MDSEKSKRDDLIREVTDQIQRNERDNIVREIGYEIARVDLLEVLIQMKNAYPDSVWLLNEIYKRFEHIYRVRVETNFLPNRETL